MTDRDRGMETDSETQRHRDRDRDRDAETQRHRDRDRDETCLAVVWTVFPIVALVLA